MDKLTRFLVKRAFKKQAEKAIAKIEGLNLQEGIYLNVFNSGVKINLSKALKRAREYGIKEAKKRLKKL